jgi:hypothetical protein
MDHDSCPAMAMKRVHLCVRFQVRVNRRFMDPSLTLVQDEPGNGWSGSSVILKDARGFVFCLLVVVHLRAFSAQP